VELDATLKVVIVVPGCRAHIFPLMALKGRRGEGSSQSRITETSMCGHQLFYISTTSTGHSFEKRKEKKRKEKNVKRVFYYSKQRNNM
jgi:hypothetical protein